MKKIKLIVIILISVILLWVVLSLMSHRLFKPANCAHTLKIMTYNTHGMMIGETLSAQKDMLRYINSQDADIVCLQEVLVYKDPQLLTLDTLRNAMSNYPYTYYDFIFYNDKRQFGNVVFSRYPLINKSTINYESTSNISSQCDIVVGQDTIRLITNHLESYKFNHRDMQLFEEIGYSPIVQKVQDSDELRHKQAKEVKQKIRESPYPIVVVGDFNAIPLSYVYWKIKWGLRDCFLSSSFGKLGNTFRKGILGVRIEYILCSRDLTPINCTVDEVNYSDHSPVIATIGW